MPRKIEIVSDLAHFKKPFSTKIQVTYSIPPISTVIGIMKNIFSSSIDNFIFGYVFKTQPYVFRDIHKIYKEVNLNARTNRDRYDKYGKWITDIAEIHYLVNPKLIIYTDLSDKMDIKETLTFGKTDCLARVVKDEKVELKKFSSQGFNQFTSLDIGSGKPMRITTETKYNGLKGYYDVYRKIVRLSNSFNYDNNYDEALQQNIFLWKYEGEGVVSESI